MCDHPTSRTRQFAIYARSATVDQRSDHLAAQVERCRAHAHALGLPVVAVYTEVAPGHHHAARPQLRTLEAAVLNGEIDGVIATSLDRLGRAALDVIDLLAAWEELGVEVVLVEPSEDSEAMEVA